MPAGLCLTGDSRAYPGCRCREAGPRLPYRRSSPIPAARRVTRLGARPATPPARQRVPQRRRHRGGGADRHRARLDRALPRDLRKEPGAATQSPARNTPSPRSSAGRSRHVVPGRSSAPVRPSITIRRCQTVRFARSGNARSSSASRRRVGRVGLAGAHRHLRLDELLPCGREGLVGARCSAPPSRTRPDPRPRTGRRGGSPARGRCRRCGRSSSAVSGRPAARGRRTARPRRSRVPRGAR